MYVRAQTIIAVAAAAATYIVTIDTADAQTRRSGGGGGASVARSSTGTSVNRSFTSTRSITSSNSATRSFTSSGGNASRTINRSVTASNQGNASRTVTQQTVQSNNTVANRITQTGNAGNNQRILSNNTAGNTNQAGNTGINPQGARQLPGGNNPVGNAISNANRNAGNLLAPNLRSGLGVGTARPANFVPAKIGVTATTTKLGRIAPPANLVPRLTLASAPLKITSNRWKPFLQRHWRSAFFWIAIPTIGYVTVPDWAYERFTVFVSSPEPDYDGAIKYLSEVAVHEEGNRVVRVAAPAPAQIRHTVAIAPEQTLDQRFAAFVNRQWSTEFVWISIPRIGMITCPVALYDQVQPMLAQNPPRFAEALSVLEEAAAADTVVEEGALNDQAIESVQ